MATPALNIPTLPSSIDGFTTMNEIARKAEGFGLLQRAVTLDLDGTTVISVIDGRGYRHYELGSGQVLAAGETVEFPKASDFGAAGTRVVWFKDATDASANRISVKVTSGSNSFVLPPGEWVGFYSTGAELEALRTFLDFHWFVGGAIGSSAVLIEVPVSRDLILPEDMLDSAGYAGTAPSGGGAAFDIQKNGSSIATMTFAVGVQTSTFTNAAADAFAAGDRLKVVAPATPNSIASVGFTFRMLALGG